MFGSIGAGWDDVGEAWQFTPTSGAELETVITNITSQVGALLPVGIGIMAIFIGIALIPRIIRKFV